jgi:hypothetical protein
MEDREFISQLVGEVEHIRSRIAAQTAAIERHDSQNALAEERAALRNLTMQLDGLRLLLLRSIH